MARPWRVQFPDAVYHVTSRGNSRQDIFLDIKDRQDFLTGLGAAVERFNLHVFAFCLMSNHFHLFLRTPDANLSAAMQWLNGTYTQRFNRRHDRNGHLFQGRYKGVLVADDLHWLHLTAYIHLNPVRAGLVQDPGSWEWSSFREYTRSHKRFAWVREGEVLSRFGLTDRARRRNYRRHLVALSGRPPSFWEDIRQAVFFGHREKWDELIRDHPPAGRREAVPEFRQSFQKPADFEAELSRVAEAFGVLPEGIMNGRRVGHVRPALYYHLVITCGLSVTRTADLMHVSAMAVSSGIRRVRDKMERDKNLERKLKAIMFNV
jgi:putative transposase